MYNGRGTSHVQWMGDVSCTMDGGRLMYNGRGTSHVQVDSDLSSFGQCLRSLNQGVEIKGKGLMDTFFYIDPPALPIMEDSNQVRNSLQSDLDLHHSIFPPPTVPFTAVQ